MKYVCEVCGYIYDPAEGDPDNGIAPGTAFEDLPDDWVCPMCGVGKGDFKPEKQKNKKPGAKSSWFFVYLPLFSYFCTHENRIPLNKFP